MINIMSGCPRRQDSRGSDRRYGSGMEVRYRGALLSPMDVYGVCF